MSQGDVEWVRDAFASGEAAKLRLLSGHTVHECGAAAGIGGDVWWKFETGRQSITSHRAPLLADVLRRMQNGERLTAGSADAAPVHPEPAARPVSSEAVRERDLLLAADAMLQISPADLVAAAPTWDSRPVREMRAAARRILRRRIAELGGDSQDERQP